MILSVSESWAWVITPCWVIRDMITTAWPWNFRDVPGVVSEGKLPAGFQNSERRLSAVGPYTCTERLLMAIKQVNGSLPEPTAIPQREGDQYRSPVRLTSPQRYSRHFT